MVSIALELLSPRTFRKWQPTFLHVNLMRYICDKVRLSCVYCRKSIKPNTFGLVYFLIKAFVQIFIYSFSVVKNTETILSITPSKLCEPWLSYVGFVCATVLHISEKAEIWIWYSCRRFKRQSLLNFLFDFSSYLFRYNRPLQHFVHKLKYWCLLFAFFL